MNCSDQCVRRQWLFPCLLRDSFPTKKKRLGKSYRPTTNQTFKSHNTPWNHSAVSPNTPNTLPWPCCEESLSTLPLFSSFYRLVLENACCSSGLSGLQQLFFFSCPPEGHFCLFASYQLVTVGHIKRGQYTILSITTGSLRVWVF